MDELQNKTEQMTEQSEQVPLKRNKYADKMSGQSKKKLPKQIKIGAGIVAAGLVVGAVAFGVLHKGEKPMDESEHIGYAMRGMLETYVEGDGTTAARTREELGKELKGKVSELLVEVGDTVAAGDTLLVIDPVETRKELSAAQDELTDAQKGVSSAQSEVATAQSAVDAAQKQLSKLTITAPFSGKIVPADPDKETTYRVGQQISSGEVIGYMVNDSVMQLPLYLNYAYLDQVSNGQHATISVPSSMSTIDGTITEIENVQKTSADGTVLFRAVISFQNPGALTAGMAATASITLSDGSSLLPADASSLEYSREEAITAAVDGEITSVNGVAYYRYQTGAPIMTLTSDSAANELKTAQNGVTTALASLETARKAVTDKQEHIDEVKEQIAQATIVSPIDGVVVSLPVTEGSEVGGAEAVCVVADMQDIVVNASIPVTDVSNVQQGQPAIITLYDNEGEKTFNGTVESVSLEATQAQGGNGSMATYPAVISLDNTEGQTLLTDFPVNFKITINQADDCVMVPSSAVVNTENGSAVFARMPALSEGEEPSYDVDNPFPNAMPIPEGTDGIPTGFYLVPIEIGMADATNTEIISGIEEGTEVFLAGPEDLYPSEGNTDTVVAVG